MKNHEQASSESTWWKLKGYLLLVDINTYGFFYNWKYCVIALISFFCLNEDAEFGFFFT